MRMRNTPLAAFAAAILIGTAVPALADPHDHHDDAQRHGDWQQHGDWQRHDERRGHDDWRHDDWRGPGEAYYPPPPVVYGAAPGYYAPLPPVVYAPPGISFGVTIP